jgi:threonine/homoserine/homoserine lactone efflux protein
MYSYYSCLEAIFYGIVLAAPIGPISLLCLRTSLESGPRMGGSIVLGIATADTIYASLTLFGLEVFSSFLLEYTAILKMAGGSALAIMAIRTLLSKGKTAESGSSPLKKVEGGFMMSSITTLFLTLANPMTILTFGAAFMGLGLAPDSPFHAALLALCVGSGSAIWHCGLVGVGGILREKLNAGALKTINRLSVVSILALSIWMIVC